MSTKRVNEQINNNISKFPERFRFQLTEEELYNSLWSKKSTLNKNDIEKFLKKYRFQSILEEVQYSSWSKILTLNKSNNLRSTNVKYLPHALTRRGFLYGYETKKLNRQVKRNIVRFHSDFMFQITIDEFKKI